MAEENKDDYQVMPVEELKKLKREIEYLKQGSPAAASTDDFVSATDKLTEKIEALEKIFEDATDEMRKEDKETQLLSERIEPLLEKIDILMDQNRKIAKGLVVIADLVKEMKDNQKLTVVKKEEIKRPEPMMQTPRQMQGPGSMPPLQDRGMPPPQGMGMPPIPGGFADMPPLNRGSGPMPPPQEMGMPPPMDLPPLPRDLGPMPPPREEKRGFFHK